MQSGRTAGPDGFRESSAHHSNGIKVPMNRQASLDCVGTTDCTITFHVWMAPALQEIVMGEAQSLLAVMCPAC